MDDRRLKGGLRDLWGSWGGHLRDPGQIRDLFSKVLQSSDPLLLESTGATLFRKPDSTDVAFGGRTYREPNAAHILHSAWSAAVCEGTGVTCGAGDPMVLEHCGVSGTCLPTRQALMDHLVKSQYGEAGAALYAQLYPAMVAAIRNKDLAAFGM
jgi:hypothetical protein